MISKHDLKKILFLFVPMCITFIVLVVKLLNASYWWLGLLLGQALFLYMNEAVFRGYEATHRLGDERILLNMKTLGWKKLPRIFPFERRFYFVLAMLALIFIGSTRKEVSIGVQEISNILTPERIFLRVEYPTYLETPPVERVLSQDETKVEADTASYLELKISNQKSQQWSLNVEMVSSEDDSDVQKSLPVQQDYIFQKNNRDRWAQSVAGLYDMLQMEKNKASVLNISLKNESGAIYRARVEVSPIQLPVVTLETRDEPLSQEVEGEGSLSLAISATSQIPLSVIELEAHTKSGYRFNKTVAEFAGNTEREAKDLSSTLDTFGIPFAADDTLYVKAVAKTVVSGMTGESRTLQFVVKSRQQIRTEILAKLGQAMQEYQNEAQPLNESRERIARSLEEAEDLSRQLGQRSLVRRKISEALALSERMQGRKDSFAVKSQAKIRDAIEALQRAKTMQESANLYARLQNLKNNISRSENGQLPKLADDATQLSSDAQKLKNELRNMIQEPSSGLTNEERRVAGELLNADRTPEKIGEIAHPLKAARKTEANDAAQAALDEAQKKLAATMQILNGARQRTIRDAREKLTSADKQLQTARQHQGQQATPDIKAAQEKLESVPRMGREFNEGVTQAQEAATGAQEGVRAGDDRKKRENLDAAQDGIVQALAALQEEESEDRNTQHEMEGTDHRSQQELVSVQGVLDAGWRKRILEEISRLKASGEPDDSPLLKYLESKLR